MNYKEVTRVLIDSRNKHLISEVANQVKETVGYVGLDCETHDMGRHDGLNRYCKYKEDGSKPKGSPLVFDTRKTVITGFSVYVEGSDSAYYFNLNHKDFNHRLFQHEIQQLLDNLAGAKVIAHNAAYEIMAFKSLGVKFNNIMCTMQLAASCYGPDEYDRNDFLRCGTGPLAAKYRESIDLCKDYYGSRDSDPDISRLFASVLGKQSHADASYNGFVKSLSYSYGLKKAVEKFCGYSMKSYEDTLQGKSHMGLLTGPEAAYYGCDDAIWCVRLAHQLFEYALKRSPEVVQAFFDQENPMVPVYADLWTTGCRIDLESVQAARQKERENFVRVIRKLHTSIKENLPFKPQMNQELSAYEKWYVKNWESQRSKLEHFGSSELPSDSFEAACRVRSAVSISWAAEQGLPGDIVGPNFSHYRTIRTLLYDLFELDFVVQVGKVQSDAEAMSILLEKARQTNHPAVPALEALSKQGLPGDIVGPNFSHYMTIRTLLYDLFELDLVVQAGKVQSDAEARGILLEKARQTNHPAVPALEALSELARIDQSMKLYLTPYLDLTDPETHRVYPVIGSQLATRRLSGRYPNPMQLSKYGESSYVRGFYLPDQLDHVMISLDWSGIELVIIGELSGDPVFKEVYGSLPHGDLHIEAAAEFYDCTVDALKEIKNLNPDEYTGKKYGSIDLVDHRGRALTPSEFWKYARSTSVGKGMNFGFWYSGSLASLGKVHNWDQEDMWEVTERYKDRFQAAEEWRLFTLSSLKNKGYVKLPDGHRRYRYEATEEWRRAFLTKFSCDWCHGAEIFWQQCADSIQRRAGNQGVNALVQGTCSALLKRSVLNIYKELKAKGWTNRDARFMIPVHDELVWSVHRDRVVEFLHIARRLMANHPQIIQDLKLDTGVSLGLSFQPYDVFNAPTGQIELDDLPPVPGVVAGGGRATDNEVELIVNHLFETRNEA